MKNEDFFYISVQIYEQSIYKWFLEEYSKRQAKYVLLREVQSPFAVMVVTL